MNKMQYTTKKHYTILKAKPLEFLPGSKLKVLRDFLNNIGMTDSLIPLDIHIQYEMRNK
jgi:hypothetical protein